MQFLRVYLESDGNIKRGAITAGELVPDPISRVWFCPDNGMIVHEQHNQTVCYSYTKIPGNESFRVVFFKNHFEYKTFNELVNMPVDTNKKDVKNDRRKNN